MVPYRDRDSKDAGARDKRLPMPVQSVGMLSSNLGGGQCLNEPTTRKCGGGQVSDLL